MGCGLRREIESMLTLAGRSSDVKLVLGRRGPSHIIYALEHMTSAGPVVVGTGGGKSKREALENLLAHWRALGTWNGIVCPAQSSEELRVKMDLLRDEHTENTEVGRPAEKQQSTGLASRLLSCLGIRLVDCSKSLGERNMWMMKWSDSLLTVFYKCKSYYRCHFELEPPIDSSFPKFLAKEVAAFEDPSATGTNFTVWKENPFFGMSEEQMKIMADLMCEPIERKQEDGQ